MLCEERSEEKAGHYQSAVRLIIEKKGVLEGRKDGQKRCGTGGEEGGSDGTGSNKYLTGRKEDRPAG